MRFKAAILALAFCSAVAASAVPQGKRQAPAKQDRTAPALTIDDVLWWLPEDTETVTVARGPFQIVKPTPPAATAPLLEKSLQLVVLGNLAGPAEEDGGDEDEDLPIPKALMGLRIQFAVEGSRNFQAPGGLGGMLYEGCSIIVLATGLGGRGDTLVKELEAAAHPEKKDLDGYPALIWTEKLESDDWTFYLVRPRPNVFMVATQEAYLREVLGRMSNRASSRAFPDSIPQWKYVDRQARYWAVRHYDRQRLETDPSSPFGGRKAANAPDEQAIGIAFSYSAAGGAPVFYYFSENPRAVEIAKYLWNHPEEGLVPKARPVSPSVAEVTVTVEDENGISMFLFILLAVLGHGVFL